MFDLVSDQLDQWVTLFTQLWPAGSLLHYEHNVRGLLATLLVCLVCGAMGALVVGNRMAFFSDALAHCAFAGIGIGILIFVIFQLGPDDFRRYITLIMVVFGVGIGLLIAYVRESTGLASDTVIGVFYAGAIGLGAVFTKLVAGRVFFDIESFVFGDPLTAQSWDILLLLLLAVATAVFLVTLYNPLVLASANASLALSRRVPVRLCHYLFIVLLGLLVNLSLQIVGILLINGLLIVPAATAANLARNLRQMFWLSIGLALFAGFAGYLLSWEISIRYYPHTIGTTGTIVVLSVVLFVASMIAGPALRDRQRLPLPKSRQEV